MLGIIAQQIDCQEKALVCILDTGATYFGGKAWLKSTLMWMHFHVAGFLLEESCVIIRGDSPYSRRSWNLVVVATSLFLLVASGCTKQDPYTPPDLLYYFASYKVGKNPTTVTPIDVNQDGLTDLLTTNIGSDTLSILLGNGDGTFRDQVQLTRSDLAEVFRHHVSDSVTLCLLLQFPADPSALWPR